MTIKEFIDNVKENENMTAMDKWDRFLYLRMMFANGYRNAENLRTVIKNEFKTIDRGISDLNEALKIMKKSLEAKKEEQSDTSKYPYPDYYGKPYKKAKKFEEDDWEEQRAGINYWSQKSK